jgi:hypothetical protein
VKIIKNIFERYTYGCKTPEWAKAAVIGRYSNPDGGFLPPQRLVSVSIYSQIQPKYFSTNILKQW